MLLVLLEGTWVVVRFSCHIIFFDYAFQVSSFLTELQDLSTTTWALFSCMLAPISLVVRNGTLVPLIRGNRGVVSRHSSYLSLTHLKFLNFQISVPLLDNISWDKHGQISGADAIRRGCRSSFHMWYRECGFDIAYSLSGRSVSMLPSDCLCDDRTILRDIVAGSATTIRSKC